MLPRPHDQHVEDLGVLLLDGLVGVERAVEVLGVKPAAHGHDRRGDLLEMREQVPRLPESVVVWMLGQAIPERDPVLKVLGVGVLERSQIHEELIAVRSLVIETLDAQGGRLRTRLAEDRHEIERMRQKECPMMTKIIEEPVGNRRLRRHGFQSGVGVDHAGRGIEARVRDAPEADPAVMVGNVCQQPFDRVVGVGAFVNVFLAFFLVQMRPHVHEPSFG